jgi:ABC-type transporter Mla MlaB component
MQETAFVILNMRRVNEIDSTGARALLEVNAMLQASTTLADLLTPPLLANPFSAMRASLRR